MTRSKHYTKFAVYKIIFIYFIGCTVLSSLGLTACEENAESVVAEQASTEADTEQEAGAEQIIIEETDNDQAEEAGVESTDIEPVDTEANQACEANCTALLDCLNTSEDNACQTDSVGLAQVSMACQARCESFAPFSVIASGIDSCENWLVFAEQQLEEEWLSGCGTNVSISNIDCNPFGERIASCMVEECVPLDTYEIGLAGLMSSLCQEQASMDAEAAAFLASVNENMPCNHPILEAYSNYFLQENPMDPEAGSLVDICGGNLQNPAETCENACRHLGPCIPPGSDGEDLADYDTCIFYCALFPDIPSELWLCIEESPLCTSVGGCFELSEDK